MIAESRAMNSIALMTRCLPRPRLTYFRRYADLEIIGSCPAK